MSSSPAPYSVLFLGKKDDANCEQALAFLRRHFATVEPAFGAWGERLPETVRAWSGDYVISLLSRWVVPRAVLERAARGALNFHPAPPEYPGIGCTNFALYEEASRYGVTCHHMDAAVDTGRVVMVRRFPILPTDDIASLLFRTHQHLLALFFDILSLVAEGTELPASDERWTRRPFTREELDALARIDPSMSAQEVQRRIRATAFGSWRPFIELHGHRWELAS